MQAGFSFGASGLPLLRGSGDLVSKVISTLIGVISIIISIQLPYL